MDRSIELMCGFLMVCLSGVLIHEVIIDYGTKGLLIGTIFTAGIITIICVIGYLVCRMIRHMAAIIRPIYTDITNIRYIGSQYHKLKSRLDFIDMRLDSIETNMNKHIDGEDTKDGC